MNRYYSNPALCILCGGRCCKECPAPHLPSGIAALFHAESLAESVKRALRTGKYQIDWWDNYPKNLYFVRPAIKTTVRKWYDPSWGGECVFLSDTGCKLPWEQRPYYCKTVEPIPGGNCDTHLKFNNSKWHAAKAWKRSGVDLWRWHDAKEAHY